MTLTYRSPCLARLKYFTRPRTTAYILYAQSSTYSAKQASNMAPQRKRDTHFLCFPLVTTNSIPQLARSLAHFRDVTTASTYQKTDSDDESGLDQNVRVIPEKAHRPPGTFHLTLGTMDLSEADSMNKALGLLAAIDYADVLKSVEKDVRNTTIDSELAGQPSLIKVDLKGLGAFNSPTNARVFFANPYDETDRLYRFGLAIRQKFKDAGFITETRPLVLHATVANMSYVRNHGSGNRGRGRNRGRMETVDGQEIVRVFNEGIGPGKGAESEGGYVWAKDIVIDRVRLCKMGAEKSDNEVWGLEYKPIAEKLIFDVD